LTRPALDSFTSPTLKDLRERWWDRAFTEFLAETLRPRPGTRILDVGCGEGLAQVSIGHLHISQMRQFGIDLVPRKVVQARERAAAHNLRAGFAVADARRLPFRDGAFDSIFCVAVLQHVPEAEEAVQEFARVTRRGGRVLAVEPDNRARYGYSSIPAGQEAFEALGRYTDAWLTARGEARDVAVGPRLPTLFAGHGIEPLHVRLFPVSHAALGHAAAIDWEARRRAGERLMKTSPDAGVRTVGAQYLAALAAYEAAARQAGATFVEIQHTMLFATVGQRAAD
jgi:ubiquinone/menaquinone biosynthesis C-methylase UbiE